MQDLRVYVISLAEGNPRRAAFLRQLDALGVQAEVLDAVDGRNGLPDVWCESVDRTAAARVMQRSMTDAEFACALSHRLAQEAFLASDAEWALVMEDDVLLDNRLPCFLRAGGYRTAPILLLCHLNARVMSADRPVPGCDSPALRLALSPFRAAAYTMNRTAAAHLVAAQCPVTSVADWPLDLADLDGHVLLPELARHPVAEQNKSSLDAGRIRHRQRSLRSYLSLGYLRRKWRKAMSRKVS